MPIELQMSELAQCGALVTVGHPVRLHTPCIPDTSAPGPSILSTRFRRLHGNDR